MQNIPLRLKKVFENADFDTAIIMNPSQMDSNFLYLSGFPSGVFEMSFIIATRKKLVLLTSILEYELAVKQKPKGMDVIQFGSRADISKIMRQYSEGKTVAINEEFLPYAYYKFIKKAANPKKIVDAGKAFDAAREIKGADEIENIKKAVKITKTALEAIESDFANGITEKQIAAKFDYLMMKHGAEKAAFDSIVSFGPNTALPHHLPDDTKLKPNNFIILDVGAKYHGYCADITRTFIYKPDRKSLKCKRMSNMYETVQKAQALGLEMVKPQVDGMDVHKAVAKYIDSARNGIYKGKFIHALGHGIGLDVHDNVALSLVHKQIKEGMVMSDEPGIYINGFGGVRLEDDILVRKDKGIFL